VRHPRVRHQPGGRRHKSCVYSFSHFRGFRAIRAESEEPLYFFNPIGSKATVCAFTLTPNVIITGHESGKVALFNVKTGEEIDNNERAHSDVVTDLQLSKDRTYCVTSSKDKIARIHDTKNLMIIKTYTTETPLNSAALAPTRPYVRLVDVPRFIGLIACRSSSAAGKKR
jgi:WD40 repeat protein